VASVILAAEKNTRRKTAAVLRAGVFFILVKERSIKFYYLAWADIS